MKKVWVEAWVAALNQTGNAEIKVYLETFKNVKFYNNDLNFEDPLEVVENFVLAGYESDDSYRINFGNYKLFASDDEATTESDKLMKVLNQEHNRGPFLKFIRSRYDDETIKNFMAGEITRAAPSRYVTFPTYLLKKNQKLNAWEGGYEIKKNKDQKGGKCWK